jgi:hypothetical protein
MLQPKKNNPNQKTKRRTAPGQYTSDVDWNKVRAVNDNVAVQVAKMFDPTGISSYPDVYYAGKDLYEGKGSWGELGLNVIGALPMVGKAKTIFRLAKAAKASKTIKNTKKVINAIEEVASKANKITNPANIKPLIKAKSVVSSSKQIGKADVKNVTIDLLDLANVGADASSTIKAGSKAIETPSLIDKNKTVKYYNADSKRGEVEKPGQLANVQYIPVSNSQELKMWEQQKLANGTDKDGIMKTRMNPRKKYANGTKGIGPSNYIQTPNQALNDYNIMLADVEKEVANNKVVPIVSIAGGLIQQAIGMSGSFAGQSGIKPGSKEALDKVLDVDPNKIIMTGANGIVAANGMNNVQADVEVEGGERYKTPQGQTGEFQGASHEENGIPLEVTQDPNANPEEGEAPEGTKIYSDRLKVGDKTIAERQEARERKIANLEKIASQPLVDTAVKNATKRRMMSIQKEESADLQFQEQVNNMQQMADTMVAAFGTGMTGIQDNPIGDSMEYGYGSSSLGVMKYYGGTPPTGINYGQGYNADMFKDFYAKYNELNPGGVMDMKYIQSDLDIDPKTRGFGKVFGPGTYKASQDWLTANKDKMPDRYATENVNAAEIGDSFNSTGLVKPFVEPTGVLAGMEKYYQDGIAKKKADDLLANPPGTRFSRTMGKIGEKLGDANEAGMIPGVGDMTKMFGNYLGMTAGIKTANEQRASDITHTNVYKNAGDQSQKMLDNAKQ